MVSEHLYVMIMVALLSSCTSDPVEDEVGEGEDHCACVVDDTADPSSLACGERLCSAMDMTGDEFIDCALEALRDRTPGIIHGSGISDFGASSWYVLINADGTAVTRSWYREYTHEEASDSILGELRAPAEFDDCLAQTEALDRTACIWMPHETELEVCDEGWEELYD